MTTNRDRTALTAERRAGDAFDSLDGAVVSWLDDIVHDAGSNGATDATKGLIRSAITFAADAGALTEFKSAVDELRNRYIDERSDDYWNEADLIEAETAAAIQEEINDAAREERWS